MKNQLNNKKVWSFKGKITKSCITFSENKANLSEDKFGAKLFPTGIYGILTARRGKNQTQFKPNTNPIEKRPKMNAISMITMNYRNFPRLPGIKTNPIQTQFKANKIALKIYPFGIDCPIVFEEKLFRFVG